MKEYLVSFKAYYEHGSENCFYIHKSDERIYEKLLLELEQKLKKECQTEVISFTKIELSQGGENGEF